MKPVIPGVELTRLRPVTRDDCGTLFQWRNLDSLIALSGSGRPVTWDEHCAWFARQLDPASHLLFLIEHQGQGIGSIRFDRLNTRADVSVYLLAAHTGRGIGVPTIRNGCACAMQAWPDVDMIIARVQPANVRSLAAFRRAGFEGAGVADGLVELQFHRIAPSAAAEHDGPTQSMIAHYSQRLAEHGISPLALDWGSAATQRRRFEILMEIADLQGVSLLDVGCGLGDLFAFLSERQIEAAYTGYDLTPAMIEVATARFPLARFEVRDIVSDPPSNAVDYVFASGIFTFLGDKPVERVQAIVRAMFVAARRGVAFNSLSNWAPRREPGEFVADPLELLAFCRTLTPFVVLRHDYFLHDFTIYLYREPVSA